MRKKQEIHKKPFALKAVQNEVIVEFVKMCLEYGWEPSEVIQVLMCRAIEEGPALALPIHRLRIREKAGIPWEKK
jgi:hypothetical protein